MNTLLQLITISSAPGAELLFDSVNVDLYAGQRLALVGANGSGKSTLLKIMSGQLVPDLGEVRLKRGLRLAVVEQFLPSRLLGLNLIHAVLDSIGEDQDTSAYKAEKVLLELGFSALQFKLTLSELSGGQQNLVLLARAIIADPELLLMDEPGNHMDIAALMQLQAFLVSKTAPSFVLISHDKTLLNKVTTHTLFVQEQGILSIEGSYDAAFARLQDLNAQRAKQAATQKKEVDRINASAKRLAQWGRDFDNEDLARKAKTMFKRAERMQEDAVKAPVSSALKLKLSKGELGSKQAMLIEDLPVFVGKPTVRLLSIPFFRLNPGERVAILAKNGAGKSTTLNLIRRLFEQDQQDSVVFNPQLRLGFYDQELASFETQQSRLDWLLARLDVPSEQVQRALINAGVSYQDCQVEVHCLSGGEKARLMFLQLQLQNPNFIVLDEPTNHIDLEGKAELARELKNSGATLIITSHDRAFLDTVATRWLWINNGVLEPLNDPELFYQSLLNEEVSANDRIHAAEQDFITLSGDQVLQRIDMLETKLSQDEARKPKFQKPQKQRLWRKELQQLWQQFEALG